MSKHSSWWRIITSKMIVLELQFGERGWGPRAQETQDPREIIKNETVVYSLESIFAEVSFFKKETSALVFSCQFWEIFKRTSANGCFWKMFKVYKIFVKMNTVRRIYCFSKRVSCVYVKVNSVMEFLLRIWSISEGWKTDVDTVNLLRSSIWISLLNGYSPKNVLHFQEEPCWRTSISGVPSKESVI